MLFSRVPVIGAMLAGLCHATPVAPSPKVGATDLAARTLKPTVFDLTKTLTDHIVYAGVVSPFIPNVQEAVNLGLALPQLALAGSVSVAASEGFLLSPTITVDLSGVKLYVEVDLAAGAAVTESVELFASGALNVSVPGLLEVDLGAAFALDLVFSVSAAIELTAGVYVTLPENAFIEVNILTKEISKSNLEGLLAQTLPIALGAVDLAAEIDLSIGLRLRSEIGIGAGIDILGLEAGAEALVAVWISLFDYTSTFVHAPAPAVAAVTEAISLSVGVAVEVDVEIGSLLDLSLAPSVVVTLASGGSKNITLDGSLPYIGLFGSNPATGVLSGNSTQTSPAPKATSAISNNPGNAGKGGNTGSKSGSGANSGSGETGDNSGSGSGDITSTYTSVVTYTVTSCLATVPHCPASQTQVIVTSHTTVYTTICPATEVSTSASYPTASYPVSLSSSYPASTTSAIYPTGPANTTSPYPTASYPATSSPYPSSSSSETCSFTTPSSLYPVSPLPTPSTSTYPTSPVSTPPAATVTIVESTTVCPETETSAPTAYPTNSAPASPTSYVVKPTSSPAAESSPYPSGAPKPSGTGYPAQPYPTTSPYPSSSYPVTAGAAGVQVGGLAALLIPAIVAAFL